MVRCHDCDIEEGQLHKLGCDMERCPNCLGQLISCGCPEPAEKDRIIWVEIPNLCRLCGEKWPDMFILSDEEWQRTVPKNLWAEELCKTCYGHVKALTATL